MNGSRKSAREVAMHVTVTLVHATIVKLDATAPNPAITGIDEPLKNMGQSWTEGLPTCQFFSGTLIVTVVSTESSARDSQPAIGL